MTDTILTQIRDRMIADLNADTPTGVPQATKRRYIPGEVLRTARIAVFSGEEDTRRPHNPNFPLSEHSHLMAIQVAVPVEDPADADDAAEPSRTHIAAVMGDTNLGGLALNVEEVGGRWAGNNDGGLYVLVVLMLWRVKYQTKRNDLTSKQ